MRSVHTKIAGLAVAAVATLAPSASADFPYTCDTAVCFATWCADHLGDCRDGSPRGIYCDPSGCWGCTGDIACYVLYCTVINSPVACLK